MADFNRISPTKLSFFNLPSDEDRGYPRFSSFEHRDSYIKQMILGSKEVFDRIKTAFLMQNNNPLHVQGATSQTSNALNHNLERDKVRFEVLMKTATDLFEEHHEIQSPVAKQSGSGVGWFGVEVSSVGPVGTNALCHESDMKRQVEPFLQDGTKAGLPQGLDLGDVDGRSKANENELKCRKLNSLEQNNVGASSAQAHTIKIPPSSLNCSQSDGPFHGQNNPKPSVCSEVIPTREITRLETSDCVPAFNTSRKYNSLSPTLSLTSEVGSLSSGIQTNEVSSETPVSEAGLIDLDLLKLVEVTFVGDKTLKFIPRRGDLVLVSPDERMTPTCKGFIGAYEGGDTHSFEHGELVVRIGKFDEVETGIFVHKPFDDLELYMYHRDGDWKYLGSQVTLSNTGIPTSTESSPGKHLQVGSAVIQPGHAGSCGLTFIPRMGDVIVHHAAWIEHFPHRENFRRSMVKWHSGRQVRWAQNDMLIRLFVDRGINLDQRIYSESEPIPVPAPGDHSTCRAHGSCTQTHRSQDLGYAELYRFEGSDTAEVAKTGWVFWGRTKLLFDTPFLQEPPLDWILYVGDDGKNSDGEVDELGL